eukprot:CAMPEP_0183827140 /NCGR_PEP_ID=MMETSP0807_2-20130328/2082_1 /TAXON_ID=88271 /ORGANISM="Picocystis salinarum, Strain CCMP1897" /LENGTH=400 /DNA_ID=CAMNT_0026072289 /DNA_START=8 /DNA_END=1210 /DNA_ORIENTATION=+
MPVRKSYAFVNNRGGTGKSFCLYQVATAYAKANPDLKVLIMDCSAHGDVSQYLLGGAQEPLGEDAVAFSAGTEALNKIPKEKTMAGILLAMLDVDSTAEVLTRRFQGLAINNEKTKLDDLGVHLAKHSLDEQEMPQNLWLAAGGKDLPSGEVNRNLFGEQPSPTARILTEKVKLDDWKRGGSLLLSALNRLEEDCVVFFDTDADIAGRGASLVALLAAKRYIVAVHENWIDYQRLYEDKSGFFPLLAHLNSKSATGKIHMLLFNKLRKLTKDSTTLHQPSPGRDARLSFTTAEVEKKNMAEIADDMFFRCFRNMTTNYQRFFLDNDTIQDEYDFASRFVTAFYYFPSLATKISQLKGIPYTNIVPNKVYKHGSKSKEIGPIASDTLDAIKATIDAVVKKL